MALSLVMGMSTGAVEGADEGKQTALFDAGVNPATIGRSSAFCLELHEGGGFGCRAFAD